MSNTFTPADVATTVRDSCDTRDSLGRPCAECEAVASHLELAARTLYAAARGVSEMRNLLLEARLGQDDDGTYLMTLERQKGEDLGRRFLELHDALARYAEDSFRVGELLHPTAAPKQEVH